MRLANKRWAAAQATPNRNKRKKSATHQKIATKFVGLLVRPMLSLSRINVRALFAVPLAHTIISCMRVYLLLVM